MKTINLLEEMKEVKMDPLLEAQNILETAEYHERTALLTTGFKNPRGVELNRRLKGTINRVYHISEIRKMCIRYDFKFLPPSEYCGLLDVSLGKKILQFEKLKKVEDYHAKAGRYMLLAPRELFLKNMVKLDDPILFYSIGDDMYEVVHKWGNDMSSKRRFEAIVNYFSIRQMIQNAGAPLVVAWNVIGILLLTFIFAILLPYSTLKAVGLAVLITQIVLFPFISWLDRRVGYNTKDTVLQ